MRTTSSKILPLSTLRFIVAFQVVLFHTLARTAGVSTIPFFIKWVDAGQTAVTFFFLLSGYILSIAYLRREPAVAKGRFWLARFARIFPLYFVTMLPGIPKLVHQYRDTYGMHVALLKATTVVLAAVAMVQAWFPAMDWLNYPSWSISVEAFFYLLFPFIGPVLWKLSPSRAVALGIVLEIIGGGVMIALERGGVKADNLLYQPLLHSLVFVIGILLARVHVWAMGDERQLARLRSRSTALLLTSLALYMLLVALRENFPTGLFSVYLLVFPFAGILLALASGGSRVSGWLSHPVLVLLGEASFGLYLLHVPVFFILQKVGLPEMRGGYIASLAIVVGLSVASFYLFETPLRTRILAMVDRKPRESVLASSMSQ